jgi:putative transposase
MKRSEFSDSQIIDAVKRVEAGIGVPDMCRELGISTATFTNGGPSTAVWMCP